MNNTFNGIKDLYIEVKEYLNIEIIKWTDNILILLITVYLGFWFTSKFEIKKNIFLKMSNTDYI